MKLVVVESPFAGTSEDVIERAAQRKENITYLRRALRDCFMRGEAPFASHAIYTQHGVLDDDKPEERQLGIDAGLLWGAFANTVAIYVDKGISRGMKYGIRAAALRGAHIEVRALDREVTKEELKTVFDAAGPPPYGAGVTFSATMSHDRLSVPKRFGSIRRDAESGREFYLHVEDSHKLVRLREMIDGEWRDVETATSDDIDWWESFSSELLFEYEARRAR